MSITPKAQALINRILTKDYDYNLETSSPYESNYLDLNRLIKIYENAPDTVIDENNQLLQNIDKTKAKLNLLGINIEIKMKLYESSKKLVASLVNIRDSKGLSVDFDCRNINNGNIELSFFCLCNKNKIDITGLNIEMQPETTIFKLCSCITDHYSINPHGVVTQYTNRKVNVIVYNKETLIKLVDYLNNTLTFNIVTSIEDNSGGYTQYSRYSKDYNDKINRAILKLNYLYIVILKKFKITEDELTLFGTILSMGSYSLPWRFKNKEIQSLYNIFEDFSSLVERLVKNDVYKDTQEYTNELHELATRASDFYNTYMKHDYN
jgi:hypothetical protein